MPKTSLTICGDIITLSIQLDNIEELENVPNYEVNIKQLTRLSRLIKDDVYIDDKLAYSVNGEVNQFAYEVVGDDVVITLEVGDKSYSLQELQEAFIAYTPPYQESMEVQTKVLREMSGQDAWIKFIEDNKDSYTGDQLASAESHLGKLLFDALIDIENPNSPLFNYDRFKSAINTLAKRNDVTAKILMQSYAYIIDYRYKYLMNLDKTTGEFKLIRGTALALQDDTYEVDDEGNVIEVERMDTEGNTTRNELYYDNEAPLKPSAFIKWFLYNIGGNNLNETIKHLILGRKNFTSNGYVGGTTGLVNLQKKALVAIAEDTYVEGDYATEILNLLGSYAHTHQGVTLIEPTATTRGGSLEWKSVSPNAWRSVMDDFKNKVAGMSKEDITDQFNKFVKAVKAHETGDDVFSALSDLLKSNYAFELDLKSTTLQVNLGRVYNYFVSDDFLKLIIKASENPSLKARSEVIGAGTGNDFLMSQIIKDVVKDEASLTKKGVTGTQESLYVKRGRMTTLMDEYAMDKYNSPTMYNNKGEEVQNPYYKNLLVSKFLRAIDTAIYAKGYKYTYKNKDYYVDTKDMSREELVDFEYGMYVNSILTYSTDKGKDIITIRPTVQSSSSNSLYTQIEISNGTFKERGLTPRLLAINSKKLANHPNRQKLLDAYYSEYLEQVRVAELNNLLTNLYNGVGKYIGVDFEQFSKIAQKDMESFIQNLNKIIQGVNENKGVDIQRLQTYLKGTELHPTVVKDLIEASSAKLFKSAITKAGKEFALYNKHNYSFVTHSVVNGVTTYELNDIGKLYHLDRYVINSQISELTVGSTYQYKGSDENAQIVEQGKRGKESDGTRANRQTNDARGLPAYYTTVTVKTKNNKTTILGIDGKVETENLDGQQFELSDLVKERQHSLGGNFQSIMDKSIIDTDIKSLVKGLNGTGGILRKSSGEQLSGLNLNYMSERIQGWYKYMLSPVYPISFTELKPDDGQLRGYLRKGLIGDKSITREEALFVDKVIQGLIATPFNNLYELTMYLNREVQGFKNSNLTYHYEADLARYYLGVLLQTHPHLRSNHKYYREKARVSVMGTDNTDKQYNDVHFVSEEDILANNHYGDWSLDTNNETYQLNPSHQAGDGTISLMTQAVNVMSTSDSGDKAMLIKQLVTEISQEVAKKLGVDFTKVQDEVDSDKVLQSMIKKLLMSRNNPLMEIEVNRNPNMRKIPYYESLLINQMNSYINKVIKPKLTGDLLVLRAGTRVLSWTDSKGQKRELQGAKLVLQANPSLGDIRTIDVKLLNGDEKTLVTKAQELYNKGGGQEWANFINKNAKLLTVTPHEVGLSYRYFNEKFPFVKPNTSVDTYSKEYIAQYYKNNYKAQLQHTTNLKWERIRSRSKNKQLESLKDLLTPLPDNDHLILQVEYLQSLSDALKGDNKDIKEPKALKGVMLKKEVDSILEVLPMYDGTIVYDDFTPENIATIEDFILRRIGASEIKTDKYFLNKITDEMNSVLKEVRHPDFLTNMFISFQEHLQMLITRIPTSGGQSLGYSKVAYFTASDSNKVYVPDEFLYVQGADLDVDKGVTLMRGKDKLSNRLLDEFLGAMKDAKNWYLNHSPVSVDMPKKLKNELIEKKKNIPEESVSLIFNRKNTVFQTELFIQNAVGKKQVGVYATAIKIYGNFHTLAINLYDRATLLYAEKENITVEEAKSVVKELIINRNEDTGIDEITKLIAILPDTIIYVPSTIDAVTGKSELVPVTVKSIGNLFDTHSVQQSILKLSAMVNYSTDNEKELGLAIMNSTMQTAGLISTYLMLGDENGSSLDFTGVLLFSHPTVKEILTLFSKDKWYRKPLYKWLKEKYAKKVGLTANKSDVSKLISKIVIPYAGEDKYIASKYKEFTKKLIKLTYLEASKSLKNASKSKSTINDLHKKISTLFDKFINSEITNIPIHYFSRSTKSILEGSQTPTSGDKILAKLNSIKANKEDILKAVNTIFNADFHTELLAVREKVTSNASTVTNDNLYTTLYSLAKMSHNILMAGKVLTINQGVKFDESEQLKNLNDLQDFLKTTYKDNKIDFYDQLNNTTKTTTTLFSPFDPIVLLNLPDVNYQYNLQQGNTAFKESNFKTHSLFLKVIEIANTPTPTKEATTEEVEEDVIAGGNALNKGEYFKYRLAVIGYYLNDYLAKIHKGEIKNIAPDVKDVFKASLFTEDNKINLTNENRIELAKTIVTNVQNLLHQYKDDYPQLIQRLKVDVDTFSKKTFLKINNISSLDWSVKLGLVQEIAKLDEDGSPLQGLGKILYLYNILQTMDTFSKNGIAELFTNSPYREEVANYFNTIKDNNTAIEGVMKLKEVNEKSIRTNNLLKTVEQRHRRTAGDVKNKRLSNVILRLIERLSNKFGITTVIASTDELRGMGIPTSLLNSNGFSYKGTLYLNSDIMTEDTPIHEFTHVYFEMLKQTNPAEFNVIMQEFLQVLESDVIAREILDSVMQYYPDYSKERQLEEALVEYLGREITKSVKSTFIEKLWEKLRAWFSKVIGNKVLKNNYTIKSIANKVSKQLLRDTNLYSTYLHSQNEQRNLEKDAIFALTNIDLSNKDVDYDAEIDRIMNNPAFSKLKEQHLDNMSKSERITYLSSKGLIDNEPTKYLLDYVNGIASPQEGSELANRLEFISTKLTETDTFKDIKTYGLDYEGIVVQEYEIGGRRYVNLIGATNKDISISKKQSLFGISIPNMKLKHNRGDAKLVELYLTSLQLQDKLGKDVVFNTFKVAQLSRFDNSKGVGTLVKDAQFVKNEFNKLYFDTKGNPRGTTKNTLMRFGLDKLVEVHKNSNNHKRSFISPLIEHLQGLERTSVNQATLLDTLIEFQDGKRLADLQAVKDRLKTEYDLATSQEEKNLYSLAILDLQKVDTAFKKNMDTYISWANNPSNFSNPLVQHLTTMNRTAFDAIANRFWEYKEQSDKHTKEFIDAVRELIPSTVSMKGYREYYDLLWEKDAEGMRTGKLINHNTSPLVNNVLYQSTYKLLLSDKRVSGYIDFILESKRKAYTAMLERKGKSYKDLDAKNKEFDANWEYNIPLIGSKVSQQFFNTDLPILDRLQAVGRKLTANTNEIERIVKVDSTTFSIDEFENNNMFEIGFNVRHSQKRLGFEEQGKDRMIKNNDVEIHLEQLMSFFTVTELRVSELDKIKLDYIATVNLLKLRIAEGQGEQDSTLTFTNELFFKIFSNDLKQTTNSPEIDKALQQAQKATTWLGLSLDALAGFSQFLQGQWNMVAGIIRGANGWGDKEAFGLKHFLRAHTIMSGVAGHQTKAELGKYVGNINEIESKTYNKVDLLMKTFRVLDMDYTKLAGNGYALTANAWAESPYILQQAGDYYNKGMFLIAKMLKEGSWDAYSAVQDKNGNWKLVYDETLDTRFKQPNGQLLKDFLLQEGLAVDGKLAVGHSTQMIHKIRRLSDEAFGTFTKEDSAIMTNYAGYRFMMIFRRWITDKIDRYMAGRTDNLMEMGEPVKNADGSITWSGSFNEGVFLSIASWMSNMWATRSLAWNTLNEVQKNNIRRMVADASILTLMFAGASALFDTEERKRRKGLYNYVWGTVQDMKLVLFPHTMIHTIQNPSIAFSYINQVMNLLYHMIATPIDAMGINIIDDEQSKKAQKSAFRFLATFVPFLKTYMEITEWDRSIDDIFDGDDSYDFTNEAQVKQRSKDYQTLETYLFD